MQIIQKDLEFNESPSCTIGFFSFNQDKDSVLNSDKGRQRLRDVGIGMPLDVGEWLVKLFRNVLEQADVADQLHSFTHKHSDNYI